MVGNAHGSVVVWDIHRHQVIHSYQAPYSYLDTVAVSPDGALLAAGDSIGNIFIWDMSERDDESNASSRVLSSAAEKGYQIALSPDDEWLVTAGFSTINPSDPLSKRYASSVRVWRTSDTAPPERLEGRNLTRFSKDSRLFAYEGPNGVMLVQPATHTLIPTALGRDATALALSPQGDNLLAAYKGKLASVSTDSPLQVREWQSDENLSAIAVSTDGTVAGVSGGSVWTWSGADHHQQLLWKSTSADLQLMTAIFSDDGRRLYWGGSDGGIYVWDMQTHRLEGTLHWLGSTGGVSALSTRGSTIAAGYWSGDVALWEVGPHLPGLPKSVYRNHAWIVRDVALMSTRPYVLAGSWDGTISISDLAERTVGTMVTIRGTDDWLVANSLGVFDGSPNAIERVSWRDNATGQLVPLEALYNDFFHPGLLSDLFHGKNPVPSLDLATSLHIPGLRSMCASGIASIRSVGSNRELCISITPSTRGSNSLALNNLTKHSSLGGSETAASLGFVTHPNDPSCFYGKPLRPSSDKGSSCKRVESDPGISDNNFAKSDIQGSDLHVLTVGVSKYPSGVTYRNGEVYAQVDAVVGMANRVEDFFAKQSALVTAHPDRPNWYRHVDVLKKLRDEEATAANILQRLSEIAKVSRPEDVVLLYLAGHGRVFPDEEMFYFISYSSGPKSGQSTRSLDEQDASLSASMLADAIRKIPARRVALIIDACQSGGAVESLIKIGEIKVAAESRHSEAGASPAGVHVLVASMSVEEAQTGIGAGQRSLLTGALLDTLNDPAAFDAIGTMWTHRTFAGVARQGNLVKGSRLEDQTAVVSSVGSDFPIAFEFTPRGLQVQR